MNDLAELHDDQAQRCARADEAAAQGATAYARLLDLAETRNSGQIRHIVQFVASTYNGQAFLFDLFDIRAVDVAISNDMFVCLDALRWAKADLHRLIPDGDEPAGIDRPLGSRLAGRRLRLSVRPPGAHLRTSHDVRHLRRCAGCGGVGDGRMMLFGTAAEPGGLSSRALRHSVARRRRRSRACLERARQDHVQ